LQVQDFTASAIKLKVVIDGATHYVNKDAIQSIQSNAIYY
jgi:hypothetical protein